MKILRELINDKVTSRICLIAIGLMIISLVIPIASKQVWNVGCFALSGALTNWLAIYMLFNKVAFLKGSGSIVLQFHVFKKELRSMIINRFFTDTNIQKYIQNNKTLYASTSLISILATVISDAVDINIQPDPTQTIKQEIMEMVDQQLDEFKPNDIKEMVHQMIEEHFAWLIIWGAVFGGMIGLVTSFK